MLMMQTVMTFDWGVIVTAIMPTAAIIVTAIIGWFTLRTSRRRDREDRVRQAKQVADGMQEIKKQGVDTHVLVNDQLTREKASRLLDARANRAVLAKLMGDTPTAEETALLASLDAQIAGLAAEIMQRDVAAGTLVSSETDDANVPHEPNTED